MEPNAAFRRNVRAFYTYLGVLAIAGIAPVAASHLIETHTRVGAVGAVVVIVGAPGW